MINKTLHLLPFVIALLACLNMKAQNIPEAEYPYKRDIEKNKYDKAEEKILRRITRDSDNLECHYAAYQLYSTNGYEKKDYDKAYTHLTKARSLFLNGDEKMLDRWARDSYSGALFDFDLRRIGRLALTIADSLRSPDAYQHFLNYYKLAPVDLLDSATDCRDTIEFDLAFRAGTVPMIQDFIDRRPHAKILPQAVWIRDSLAFDGADSRHTAKAYQLFCTTYPHSILYDRAMDSVYLIEYREALGFDEELYYRGYAERYPTSPYSTHAKWLADSIEYYREVNPDLWQSYVLYLDGRSTRPEWNEKALHNLTLYALRNHDIEAARQAARRLSSRSADHDKIAELLHNAYIHTSIRNFTRFYKEFPHLMTPDQRYADSLALLAYQHYDYRQAAECIHTIAPSHEAFMMLQQILKDDIDHQRWQQALTTAQQFADDFKESDEYSNLCLTLQNDHFDHVKTTALSASINSAKGDEYAPIISHDNKTLYFAGKGRPDNIGGEDIFVSHFDGHNWSPAAIEMDLSHSYGNEVPMFLSSDGHTLLLFQSGKLLQAVQQADGWRVSPLTFQNDTIVRIYDATLANNNTVLIFSTMSRTSQEIDSSSNIYVSFLGKDGRWSNPTDLGATINTPFDENSPRISNDMNYLFFCSEGHGSLGHMDVYMSTRLDDSWTQWSQPVNMGRAINTTDNDLWISVIPNGKRAYLSRQNQSKDIYMLNFDKVPLFEQD